MTLEFPEHFKFGVATSSYQIEGAFDTDGRGTSIWDTFSKTPGKVVNAETGDIACDHYNRYKEDVALMKQLGMQTYRFSIAWPRLFPNGDTQREQRGFDFYHRLIDELIENGIEPVITLYHWDLPQALEDKGGWANRDIVDAFDYYVGECVKEFGSKVSKWITLNEPWVFIWLGYMNGIHAPGVKSLDAAIAGSHHTVLAHHKAASTIRAIQPDASVGISFNMTNYVIDDPQNAELQELKVLMDSHINRWWMDAIFNGSYPQELADFYGDQLQKFMLPGDAELLATQTDFVGVNYYSDSYLSTPKPEDKPMVEGGLFPFPHRSNGATPEPKTDIGWPVTPHGIGDLLIRIARDWPAVKSIVISENGAAYHDVKSPDGTVNDAARVEYLEGHLHHVARAIHAGAPVDAYFAWSFMDNFEWAEGYAMRFGIVYVDFTTLERTPKRSAEVYSSIISAHVNRWELAKI